MTSDSLNSRAVVRHAASQLASLTANTGNEPYTYSAFGTKAKGGTRTFLRAGAGVTASVLDDGNAKYTPGVSEVRSGTTTFSHSGLKSMGAQTDAGATPAVLATRTYDAFGATQSSSGTWQGAFGYAGAFGYQEEGSTLNLLGHRYYDASLGRFLTRDPMGDGSNWYAYCENMPTSSADADGLVKVSIHWYDVAGIGWHYYIELEDNRDGSATKGRKFLASGYPDPHWSDGKLRADVKPDKPGTYDHGKAARDGFVLIDDQTDIRMWLPKATRAAKRIDDKGLPYELLGNNSNTVAYEVLRGLDLLDEFRLKRELREATGHWSPWAPGFNRLQRPKG